jgi:hypothetical protein
VVTVGSPKYIQHSAHIEPGREGLFDLVKRIPATLEYEPGLIVADGEADAPPRTDYFDHVGVLRATGFLIAKYLVARSKAATLRTWGQPRSAESLMRPFTDSRVTDTWQEWSERYRNAKRAD